MKVITFGELLLRLAAPGYTRLFQKDSLEATFCGGEANVAVSLSVFGLDSTFITKLPDSDVGRAAANSLRYFGVDTGSILYGNGRMGLYYLEKGVSQRPSKVIYDRANSAMALSKRSEFDWDSVFIGTDWFHWTGITPSLSDEMATVSLEACRKAKELGLTVSCDLNYRAKLWTPEKAQSVMKTLMPYVDVCICNEEDAEKVLGIENRNTDVTRAELNRESYVNTAEQICLNYGCRTVATTLRKSYSASRNGWSGMLYDAASAQAFFSQEYDIQIVDRVGGGDSFAAGLIYALIAGMTHRECIEFAVAASCLKQTIEGDYNRSSVGEIDTLIRSGGSARIVR